LNINQFNNGFNQQQLTANVNNIIAQFRNNINNFVVGRQYTVFGPTNNAFRLLDDDTFDFLFNKSGGLPVLRTIVRNHILSGSRTKLQQLLCNGEYLMESNEVTTTQCLGVNQLNGGRRELQQNNNAQIKYQVGLGNGDVVNNWPRVTDGNYPAVNGVLHIVDHLILPKLNTISKF
jgi:uncharacterized surface protein with fasciclin (FAS1) repeats